MKQAGRLYAAAVILVLSAAVCQGQSRYRVPAAEKTASVAEHIQKQEAAIAEQEIQQGRMEEVRKAQHSAAAEQEIQQGRMEKVRKAQQAAAAGHQMQRGRLEKGQETPQTTAVQELNSRQGRTEEVRKAQQTTTVWKQNTQQGRMEEVRKAQQTTTVQEQDTQQRSTEEEQGWNSKQESTEEGQEQQEKRLQENQDLQESQDLQQETEELLAQLGLSELDDYLRQENIGQLSFAELIRDFMKHGISLDFSEIGNKILQIILQDYRENRTSLIQILTLALAFSILLQMTGVMQKKYITDLSFLGVYLILMLLLLKLFMIMTASVQSFFDRLVEFMHLLQPVFCISMVFSTGSTSAGVYSELLLLLIYLIDLVFARILLPIVQIYMVLELVNDMMGEERFSRIAGLLSDSVGWCTKLFTTAVLGLNIVQGLLAPGIDGVKRSAFAGAVRAVPWLGQLADSVSEMLTGSAMLIKNSVGAAALVILVIISFLPLAKIAVFMLLYRGCAALMEPVTDKRICAAVAGLGHSAALYLKLMFYAVLLFFLTIAIICTATAITV